MCIICLVWRNRIYHGGKIIPAAYRQKNFKQKIIVNAKKLFELSDRQTEELANKAGLTLERQEAFPYCLKLLRTKYEKKSRLFYKTANISERMYQYINNDRNPTKQTVLAIAAAMDMNLEDTRRLLKSAGYVLSKSVPSDAVILWLLSGNESNQSTIPLLFQINEILYALDMPLLMTREKNERHVRSDKSQN